MAERSLTRPIVALLVLLGWLALPSIATGTHRGGAIDAVTMRLSYVAPASPSARGQLVAHLAMDDGGPIADVEVEFLRRVEFLGPRTIWLGRARSDANGDARVAVEPAAEPNQVIVARFGGDEHYTGAEVVQEFTVQPLVQPPAPPTGRAALSPLSTAMPALLGLAAASVWLLMLGLVAFTVRAIRRARPTVVALQSEQERSTT